MSEFMLGFDLLQIKNGVKIPIRVPIESHVTVIGGSGSGKSTAVLYWIYKLRKAQCKFYIADFKASKEFLGISDHQAEFEDCYKLIESYYEEFLLTPEGGDGTVKILLIDEIAGLLTHYGAIKDGKGKADKIRSIMSSVLMLGRSRRCFLWLSMQRYSATIFPSASGAGDNFHVCCGMGRLTVEGRKALFAGESIDEEDGLLMGTGKGIVMIDGQPLQTLIIPKVSKQRLLELIQQSR